MCYKKYFLWLLFMAFFAAGNAQKNTADYHEKYRPQIHFSPQEHWTNDPNGMVYYHGVYHLFFQYYPDGTTWGPMHWGHAISKDLVHWKQQPIALFPDSLGYIFSGSAVVDKNNTSDFGKEGKVPLVAIFTQHDPVREKEGKTDFQNQSIAYSLDNGKTWTKYAMSPVLKNPGITDFRDPKVSWYEPEKKWVMTLATKDHVTFYSSLDLKNWKKESEFGKSLGAHGGVWECPDLFPINYKGRKLWALLVSINPGGPNKGSATQYFIGDFDGKRFTTDDTTMKWIDYGPDDYAGVLWSNTGKRRIFLGWMSNWLYANVVPTQRWRGAMTIPRDLGVEKIENEYYLTSTPVRELEKLNTKSIVSKKDITANYSLSSKLLASPLRLSLRLNKVADFSLTFKNDKDEKLVIGYKKGTKQFFIDRTKAGQTAFSKEFAGVAFAPRISRDKHLQLTLIMDKTSVELFADGGLTTMTEIFFPSGAMSQLEIHSGKDVKINKFDVTALKSIWN
ncbi:glycoside hydrolase family 32 protein [Arachidicoccus sp.]|uniref:glycoside hydrolase family 32 protein n=1 Tax=Arachidicoccus sp. TaxID=1872624 RepID=UPI003D19059D